MQRFRILTRISRHNQTFVRHCYNEVRVRFAPSPTGFLHLGGLRTALYNFLFARASSGKFILRIEDTDQTRLVPGATEQLCKDLEWAGIRPDEGPSYGGVRGPYVQSERLDLYRKEVKKLLENGTAYYCFCTERRLDLLRKDALRRREVPKYDNRCRHLTPGQVAEKLANNDTFCIRFKLESQGESFNDLIYGRFVYYVAQNEGDPVIMKSDGYPTYHFANVVDDHHMRITHVFRGVEWQISTPKHLFMYQAFGWTPPKYGHLPLIMNADGTKLSKRQNDIKIEHFQRLGILPQALLNYVTHAGGGFDRDTRGEKMQPYQMRDLVEQFDVKRINTNSSRLNPDLLFEYNRLELMEQVKDPEKCRILVAQVKEMIQTSFKDNLKSLDLRDEHIKFTLEWAVGRITTLKELIEGNLSFLWILPKLDGGKQLDPELLDLLIQSLEEQNFSKKSLNDLLKEFSIKHNLTFANLMRSLRGALSGLKEGPSVAEMMEVLGKENTLSRLLRAKANQK